MRILVLIGTHKGRAGMIGEAIRDHLRRLGAEAEWRPMDRVDPAELAGLDAVVVCTSTFGAGGVPPNAAGLLGALSDRSVDCSGLSVGLVGLGDSSYGATFNGGHRAFAGAFAARGAAIVGPPLLFDAARPDDQPDPLAWAEAWLERLRADASHR